MITTDILIITLIITWVIDLTDFITSIKKLLWRAIFGKDKIYRDFQMKPFDCSLCSSFWCNLIYVICMGKFSLPILGYISLMAFMTPVIKDVMQMIRDIFVRVITDIYDLFKL